MFYMVVMSLILAGVPAAAARTNLPEAGATHSDDFDFFMFTQSWPITNCLIWERKDSRNNTCNFGVNGKNQWTIHGIWPTKKNKIAPSYCNNSLKFDKKGLLPILPQMETEWLNIHGHTNEFSFWKHEWVKHGTCAVQVKELDTELKYFAKGLEWARKYNVTDILKQVGIKPGHQYVAKDIIENVGRYLGSATNSTIKPAVQCAYHPDYQLMLLSEIVVCIDKDFSIRDCESIKGGVFGTCPQDGKIYIDYPNLASPYAPEAFRVTIYIVCLSILTAILLKTLYDLYKISPYHMRRNIDDFFRTRNEYERI